MFFTWDVSILTCVTCAMKLRVVFHCTGSWMTMLYIWGFLGFQWHSGSMPGKDHNHSVWWWWHKFVFQFVFETISKCKFLLKSKLWKHISPKMQWTQAFVQTSTSVFFPESMFFESWCKCWSWAFAWLNVFYVYCLGFWQPGQILKKMYRNFQSF